MQVVLHKVATLAKYQDNMENDAKVSFHDLKNTVFFFSKICTMKTRLGCLSHKSDSYNDFSEFLPPAHETTARCLK